MADEITREQVESVASKLNQFAEGLSESEQQVLACALVAAIAPAGASAATTVGSPLSRAGGDAGYCSGDSPGTRCTIVQLTLGTADQAVPGDGVITSWSVRHGRVS